MLDLLQRQLAAASVARSSRLRPSWLEVQEADGETVAVARGSRGNTICSSICVYGAGLE